MVQRERIRAKRDIPREGMAPIKAREVVEVTEPHASELVNAGAAEYYTPRGAGALGQWKKQPQQSNAREVEVPAEDTRELADVIKELEEKFG